MGIAYAPTKVKSPSGWLWAWAFAIESTSKNKPAALEFVKWATSKDYALLVNEKTGSWGGVPSGARKSLYENAGYKDYAKAFAPVVVDSLNTVDPLHATNFPDTPYTGIQYVQIQEVPRSRDQVHRSSRQRSRRRVDGRCHRQVPEAGGGRCGQRRLQVGAHRLRAHRRIPGTSAGGLTSSSSRPRVASMSTASVR